MDVNPDIASKKELENFLGGFEESKEYNRDILVNFKEINTLEGDLEDVFIKVINNK